MSQATFPAKPEVKYAESGEVSIAYMTVGEGPDVVMVPGFGSHLERAWEFPRLAHFYHRLASFCRLTLLDKRGTGLSDRVSPDALPGIEQRMEDLKAVMDQAGVDTGSLIGHSDGGPLAILFAATYPSRVDHLVLVNTYAKRICSPAYPHALPPEVYEGFKTMVSEGFGGPVAADVLAPGADVSFQEWWAGTIRASMSPAAARAMMAMNTDIDVREALPAVHVPTLVIHRVDDAANPLEGARDIASQIGGAVIVELPGADHFPWMGDSESVLTQIEQFITGAPVGAASSQMLASVLFTDIVSSTERLAELGDREWSSLLKTHDGIVAAEVVRHGGREVKHTGDGFMTVFEGPARAVRCWLSIARRVNEVGLAIRGGLHTSEVEVVADGDIRGLGVHIAARLIGMASPDELIVSSVVRDLSVGSGIDYQDRGQRELKGVPGSWQLYGVTVS